MLHYSLQELPEKDGISKCFLAHKLLKEYFPPFVYDFQRHVQDIDSEEQDLKDSNKELQEASKCFHMFLSFTCVSYTVMHVLALVCIYS